jgi:tetratricopeptide (TPR) repeat protein
MNCVRKLAFVLSMTNQKPIAKSQKPSAIRHSLIAVFCFGIAYSQQSQYFTDKENYQYHLAENLYQTKIYNAAQYEYARQYFHNPLLSASEKEAAQFFDNVIGVLLNKNQAEQGLEAFVKEHPNSAYFAQANLPLADYYLAQKDFEKALETLQKVNQYQLSREENTQYIMKLGYAKFMTGDSQGATEALEEAYNSADDSPKNDVAYMLGHLYYTDNQNDKAFEYFDSIKNNEKYSQIVRPYYVQKYYNEKNYDQAISEGNELLNIGFSKSYETELHKIIGESYFMKKDYVSAYPHLKIYFENQENPTESDLYEMGFIAAQLGNYDEAVSYYNRLINSNSAMSQNAYYQLGNAYLKTGKKQEALSAYRSAHEMDYDGNVRKLAHEQYAKLSYDIGNPFEAAPKVIQNYISQYPNGEKTPEMKSLLVKSYLYSGNYRETLNAIDDLAATSSEIDKIDQEVSFLLGTEEFNKGNFDEAEKYFLRSLKIDENKEISPRALYWLAQTYYQKENYPSAIVRYEKLLDSDFPEKQQLNYDLGYAYFKSKKFDAAKPYFQNYLKNPKPEFKNDAELRLADIYYADNQLNEAISIYEKTENANDYTLFQKAMALGFKGDTEAKISNLKNLISKYPDSEYADDANYEIAVAYAAQEDFNASNEYFSKVIKTSSDKDLIANAQIYHAQNFIDSNQNDKAFSELKSLGNQYKNTAYASKIVQAARPIFVKNGDVSGYQSFADNLGVNLDASDIDEINLTSAKNFYAKKDYKSAIPLYEKYLAQNPTGDGFYQAQYELGESCFQTKNSEKALLILHEIADVQNDYQEDAQTRIAQIYLEQNKISEAKPYLENLATSQTANIKNFANLELMEIFADEKNFSKAEKYADAVISNSKNSNAVLESAKVIKARSLMNNGKDKDAQTAYTALEKSANTEVAAEALFAKAFYQNKAKAYKTSNETIFKLANNYASEEYWGAKSLVLMAKNYLALKDNYQASYICDQILENYTDFPEITAEAKEVKAKIR